MVCWLRVHLAVQETRVQSLVREGPTCHGTTKPMPPATEPVPETRELRLLKPKRQSLCLETRGVTAVRSPPTAGGRLCAAGSPHSKHRPAKSQRGTDAPRGPCGHSQLSAQGLGSLVPERRLGRLVAPGLPTLSAPGVWDIVVSLPLLPPSLLRAGGGGGAQTGSSFHSLPWWSRLASRNTVHMLAVARLTAWPACSCQTP